MVMLSIVAVVGPCVGINLTFETTIAPPPTLDSAKHHQKLLLQGFCYGPFFSSYEKAAAL